MFTLPVFSLSVSILALLFLFNGKGLGTAVRKSSIVSIELTPSVYKAPFLWPTALIPTPSLPAGALCPPPTLEPPPSIILDIPCHACDIVSLVMAKEY